MTETPQIVEETVATKATGTLDSFEPKVTESFVYMDNVKEILNIAMKTERNAILYGPGGYGKSEFTEAFFNEAGIEPFIITMGTGMTTDRLFGGLNIPTFNATGKIEYLVENSFMNSEYVIFEELFDAPDFILEQLKDIISSGKFRNGGQVFEIKTKLIICCTNKTREEFSKNTSLKALMERFPLETKVQWKDHNRITYEHLFKTKLGGSDPLLTYVLEQYAVAGIKISPRIALMAAETILKCGPGALVHIADFNAKPELLKTSIAKFDSILEVANKVKEMEALTATIKTIPRNSIDGLKELQKSNKLLYTHLTKLKSIKADDSMISTTTEAIKRFTSVYEGFKKEIEIILATDDVDESSLSSEATNFSS